MRARVNLTTLHGLLKEANQKYMYTGPLQPLDESLSDETVRRKRQLCIQVTTGPQPYGPIVLAATGYTQA
jgi:hypothetical protein